MLLIKYAKIAKLLRDAPWQMADASLSDDSPGFFPKSRKKTAGPENFSARIFVEQAAMSARAREPIDNSPW